MTGKLSNMRTVKEHRHDALINGALIALGAVLVIDNIIFHWLLSLHRAVPGPSAGWVEVILVFVGLGLVILGTIREIRIRRGPSYPSEPRP